MSLFNHKFKVLFVLVVLLLGAGTTVYHYVESFNWIDSFYFSSMTLTTVGYGDLFPVTTFGKIFTVFYVFIGLGIILAFVNLLAKQRIHHASENVEELKVKLKKEKEKVKIIKTKKK